MSTKAELYWLRRALANSSKAFNTTEIQLLLLKRQYEKSKRKLRRDIDEFYKELGEDVSPASANQELKDRSGITRKEKLLQQIEDELDQLTTAEEQLLQKTLGGTYRGAYYRSIYEVQHKLGIGVDFALLPTRAVEQAVKTAWSGDNYSTLIWKRRKKLAKAAGEIIQDGVNLGESNDQMASKLAEIMDSSYSRAKRLIRTETAYVYNAASMEGYEEAGIERYQFLATLDMRTSKPCQRLDNQVFFLRDAQVGVNMPPIHPNCRSTTIPYFDDNELRERIARGLDGKTYKVPANMDYATWYKEHVEGKHPESEISAAQKKIKNKSQDRKQYEKIKETLGKGSPKTFAAFQQLKYNEVEKWQQTKRKVNTFSRIDGGDYTDVYKTKLKDTYQYFEKRGHEFTTHALNRTVGQKVGKDKVLFTNEDLAGWLKEKPNYMQSNGVLVRHREGVAILQAPDTKEIISVVTRSRPKADWKEV